MNKIDYYKGIEIFKELNEDDPRPFIVVEQVPVIGVLQTGHKTLQDAKKYIDYIKRFKKQS